MIIATGDIVGIVPKKNISAAEAGVFAAWETGFQFLERNELGTGLHAQFGDLIFECENIPELALGIEIGDDNTAESLAILDAAVASVDYEIDIFQIILRWGYYLNYAIIPMAIFFRHRVFKNILCFI